MNAKKGFVESVRSKKPLVLHVTNNVTVNDCANATICAGGSPLMCDSIEEIEDLVRISSSVVINIGTVNERTFEIMILAGKVANDLGMPVVLDPVGVGASTYRNEAVKNILDSVEVSVIKGNGSEISFMAGSKIRTKGVDSTVDTDSSITAKLAKKTGGIVCMTGKIDYVSDGKKTIGLCNGNDVMDKVSGTGCMLASVIGCFIGACGADIDTTTAAVSAFNIAGECAVSNSYGPGSFKPALFDYLSMITDDDIKKNMRIVK